MDNLKLNKYLINIIDKYLDQSIENILKTFPFDKHPNYILNPKMTLREIMIVCLQSGFVGFYIICKQHIATIKKLISNEKLDFISYSGKLAFKVYIKTSLILEDNNEITLVSLDRINCWIKI